MTWLWFYWSYFVQELIDEVFKTCEKLSARNKAVQTGKCAWSEWRLFGNQDNLLDLADCQVFTAIFFILILIELSQRYHIKLLDFASSSLRWNIQQILTWRRPIVFRFNKIFAIANGQNRSKMIWLSRITINNFRLVFLTQASYKEHIINRFTNWNFLEDFRRPSRSLFLNHGIFLLR